MKLYLIIFLFPLILSSTSDNIIFLLKIFDLLNSSDRKLVDVYNMVYNKLLEAIKRLEKIICSDEKKEYIELLKEILGVLIEYFRDYPEYVKKLKELYTLFIEKNLDSKILSGINVVGDTVADIFKYKILERKDELYKLFNLYLRYKSLLLPEEVKNRIFFTTYSSYPFIVKNKLENLKGMEIHSSNFSKFFGILKVGGGMLSFFSRSYEKYNRCKSRNLDAIAISSIQGATNVGTNIAFGSIGSFLGSFIPVVGTFIGGLAGNYIGSYVNSLYDFEC